MRKTLMLLALGSFLSVSVSANACDKDKASASGKSHSCCTTKASKAKACMVKNGKDCSKDPNCTNDMKASKHHVKKSNPQG